MSTKAYEKDFNIMHEQKLISLHRFDKISEDSDCTCIDTVCGCSLFLISSFPEISTPLMLENIIIYSLDYKLFLKKRSVVTTKCVFGRFPFTVSDTGFCPKHPTSVRVYCQMTQNN